MKREAFEVDNTFFYKQTRVCLYYRLYCQKKAMLDCNLDCIEIMGDSRYPSQFSRLFSLVLQLKHKTVYLSSDECIKYFAYKNGGDVVV